MSKQRRGGKIFVDYLRNGETASAVAAYSVRARPGAFVAMPLAWDELNRQDLRARFTVGNAPSRLKKEDPWRQYWRVRQRIAKKMLAAVG
jgi:bifunctional non-homologous end joining protein LigD